MTYVKKAHFIYDDDSKELIEILESNPFNTKVTSIHVDNFLKSVPELSDLEHLVVSLCKSKISALLSIAYQYDICIAIIPLPSQKQQLKHLYLTGNIDKNIEIALQENSRRVDLVKVNDDLVYSQAIIGTIPLIGHDLKKTSLPIFKTFVLALKKIFSIELQKFEITTANGQKVTTAGSAIVILNHTTKGLLAKVFNLEQSMRNGSITLVVISPYSIYEYIKLIVSILTHSKEKKKLPKSIGYIKSKSFEIKASSSKRIYFEDSKSFELPVKCEIIQDAVRFNASQEFWENNEKDSTDKETIKIDNLPDKNEANSYTSHRIPLLQSASEERFKELFQILREDSKINTSYLILMILSTLLASFGLFANSAAVIIGAMLIAPLMVPIVSISMGLLRADTDIIKNSLFKILAGIFVALLASSSLEFFLPDSEITSEMLGRINPTLLDLGVAILSGIAAAYSKSFKEIAQNLAGVAIAVALVPPLAVAGIGLGYGDMNIFLGAFLLFFTNLVGIIIAAVITFQLLGFSNVVKSKKSVIFIFALLLAVSYPLYLSYNDMISKYATSQMLVQHRFLVNNKYIIVNKARVVFHGNTKILNLSLSVREPLNRDDLETLKANIQRLFNTKLFIQTQVEYIL